jgi:ubiquitin C-terminal hydrolase
VQRVYAPLLQEMVRGILNHGNTCYVNAALQCLSACPAFLDVADGPVKDLCTAINEDAGEALDIQGFLRFMRVRRFEPGDAQEFALQLVDLALHAAPPARHVLASAGSYAELDRIMNKQWKPLRGPAERLYGQHVSQVKCGACGNVTHTPEVFAVVNLAPPAGARVATIEACLAHYFATERIEGFNCAACRKTTVAEKALRLWRLPPCLILGMPPYAFEGVEVHATMLLDMAPFALHPMAAGTFAAQSAIFHQGTARSGHYWAARKHRDKWYACDDDRVADMSHASARPHTFFFHRTS